MFGASLPVRLKCDDHCCLWPAGAHAAAAAAAPLLAVVSPKFCMPQQTVLVMQEHAGFKSDDFTITDATGTLQLDVGHHSTGNSRRCAHVHALCAASLLLH
jgi:hypothetical protein